MFDIHEIIDNINEKMDRKVADMDHANARQLGLDPRCGRLYVNQDCIIVSSESAARTLEYYGGFSYIESEHKVQIGDYTVYLRDNGNRVEEAIDNFYEEVNETE